MARRPPDDDPRVTDLGRYRKAREQAARRKPARVPTPAQPFLGSNPRARLILLLGAAALVALLVLPQIL